MNSTLTTALIPDLRDAMMVGIIVAIGLASFSVVWLLRWCVKRRDGQPEPHTEAVDAAQWFDSR